jgi:hypothetical protein
MEDCLVQLLVGFFQFVLVGLDFLGQLFYVQIFIGFYGRSFFVLFFLLHG